METIDIPQRWAEKLALSMYVGYKCTKCGHKFSSVEDIEKRSPKCSGKDENGITLACGECFKINN